MVIGIIGITRIFAGGVWGGACALCYLSHYLMYSVYRISDLPNAE